MYIGTVCAVYILYLMSVCNLKYGFCVVHLLQYSICLVSVYSICFMYSVFCMLCVVCVL